MLRSAYLAVLQQPLVDERDRRSGARTRPWQTTRPARADDWRKLLDRGKNRAVKGTGAESRPKPKPEIDADIMVFFDGTACCPAEDGIGYTIPGLVGINPQVSYLISRRLGRFQRAFLHVYELKDGVPALATGFSLDVPTALAGGKLLAPGADFYLVSPPKGVRIRSHASNKYVPGVILQPGGRYWMELVVHTDLGRNSLVVSFHTRPAGQPKPENR